MIEWYYKELGENGEIVVIPLSGRLEVDDCDYLYSAVEKLIETGNKHVIVDCDGLEYISSMGLGMLLRLHARMKKQGGDVSLARVQGTVAKLVQLVSLDRVLGMYPSVETAIASRES
jgi:anti-anti-sigma factor